jgi:hypothetical protein
MADDGCDGLLEEAGAIGRACADSGMPTPMFARPAMVRRLVAERHRLAVLLYRTLGGPGPATVAGLVADLTYTGKSPLAAAEVDFLKALFGASCRPELFDAD